MRVCQCVCACVCACVSVCACDCVCVCVCVCLYGVSVCVHGGRLVRTQSARKEMEQEKEQQSTAKVNNYENRQDGKGNRFKVLLVLIHLDSKAIFLSDSYL